jgi:uncharacterized membrane protein YqjE
LSAALEPNGSDGAVPGTQPLEADQSLSELVSRMTRDVGKLVSTQIELAKVEIKDEVGRAGKGVGMVGGGGVAAHFALLLVSFAIAFWLGDAFGDVGLGFLTVGLVFAAVAAVLVLKGRERIASATPVAEQTIESIKEDVEWARQQRT